MKRKARISLQKTLVSFSVYVSPAIIGWIFMFERWKYRLIRGHKKIEKVKVHMEKIKV